jgi:hypothetical protein
MARSPLPRVTRTATREEISAIELAVKNMRIEQTMALNQELAADLRKSRISIGGLTWIEGKD